MEPQQQSTGVNEIIVNQQEAEQLSFLHLINGSLDKLTTLKEGRKMAGEALDSELKQSVEYVQASEKVKTETDNKKAVLKRLNQNPNVRDIRERIKDLALQIKEEKVALGTTTIAYVKETGNNLIDRNGGRYFILLNAQFKKATRKK